MLLVEIILKCDSCGKEEQKKAPYVDLKGFEVGENWYSHAYISFIQCRPCFEETDKQFEAAKKAAKFIEKLKGGRWWYEFAKGHWAYKDNHG